MKKRLILLYIIISVLPAIAIIALSIRLNSSEKAVLEEKFHSEQTRRLESMSNNSTRIIFKVEEGLLPLVESINNNPSTIPQVNASSIFVDNIFILDSSLKLRHPLKESSLSARDKDFLIQVKDLLANEEGFYTVLQTGTEGWYSWKSGKKILLWKKTQDESLVVLFIHQSELIKSISENLPKKEELKEEKISLHFADKDLFSNGQYERSANEPPKVSVALREPLTDYSIRLYRKNPEFQTELRTYGMIIGGILVSLSLGLICIYFYRENTRQARLSLQRVNFANQVSHELKTPLTSIRMYAEILEEKLEDEDPKILRNLQVIIFESQRLSRMINNVLTFASDGKNKLSLNSSKMNLDSLVHKVIDHMSPSLKKKSISWSISSNSPEEILADSDALEQILGNLIGNIEKYVPKGSEFRVATKQDEQWSVVTVSDNGPGIPNQHRNKIFNSFHRVSNKLSDGVSGTGIGLTIARKLARLHGGDLILEPSDKGACFSLKIPNKGPGNESTSS